MDGNTTPLNELRALSLCIALLFFFGAISGCSRNINERDVLGKYVAEVEGERQVIEAHADGSYDTSFYRREKLIWRRAGRWTFEYEKALGTDAVTFSDFRFGFDRYDSGRPGFWPVKPGRTLFGKIKLCFDPDLSNRCFLRVQ